MAGNNTHKVSSIEDILILRSQPSSVLVDDYSQISRNNIGNDTAIENGTNFIVLDEGLGFQCQWHKVQLGETVGYFYNKFIEKLPETPDSLEYDCDAIQPIGFHPLPVNWIQEELNKAYLDRNLKKWCVPIETTFVSGGNDLQSRLNLYVKGGLRIILKENGKKYDDDILSSILSKFISAKAEDYYIDPRPNMMMRVLVTFPKKYIAPLEDISRSLQHQSLSPAHSIQLFVRDFKDKIEKAASVMEAYAGDIDKFTGTVEDLDLRMEAERLRVLDSKLAKIIYYNGLSLDNSTILELAINQSGHCFSISENSSGTYETINMGMDKFLDGPPFDSRRTMNYVSYLSEIVDSERMNIPWSEFVSNYTMDPSPKIFPSIPKGDSGADISSNSLKERPSASGLTAADALAGIAETIGFDACSVHGEGFSSISDIKSAATSLLGKYTKRGEQTKEEINNFKLLLSTDEGHMTIKDKILEQAKKAEDFIGDEVFHKFGIKLAEVKNLDDLFEKILNKICLTDLMIPALACFEIPELSEEMKKFKESLPEIELCTDPYDRCKLKVVLSCDNPLLLDDLPTHDLMEAMGKVIWDSLIAMLTQMFKELLQDLMKLLASLCNGEDDENEGSSGGVDIGPTPNLGDELNDLLDDLASLLSPRELCSLLNGTASDTTIELVRSIVRRRHPNLAEAFSTKSSIIDFFLKLGGFVDSKMCEDLASADTDPGNIPYLSCPTSSQDHFQVNSDLRYLLSQREGITDEQIQDQIDKAKQRREDKMEKVASIMEMVAAGIRGDRSPFENLAPTLLAGPDGSGVIDLSHPVVHYLEHLVLDTVFYPVRRAFNSDSEELKNALIDDVQDINLVPYHISVEKDGRTGQSVNPEVRTFAAKYGLSLSDLEEQSKKQDGKVSISKSVRMINKRLKSLLSDVESNDVFVTGADSEGFYYELTLPPDRGIMDVLSALNEAMGGDFGFAADLVEKSPRWKVRYKVPYIMNYGDEIHIDDDFILEIFPSSEKMKGIRVSGRGKISQDVVSLINNELKSSSSDLSIFIPIGDDIELGELVTAEQTEAPDIPVCADGTTPERFTPPPQAVFGRYVNHRWKEDTAHEVLEMPAELGLKIEEYFSYGIFPQVTRDLIAMISAQTSESPILEDNVTTNIVHGYETKSYVPNVDKISFKRPQTKMEQACNVDPHLMKIKNHISELKSEIAKIDQETMIKEANTQSIAGRKPDSWSRAAMITTIKLTARAYIFDYAMRQMPSITEFSLAQSVDEYIVNFFLKKMYIELGNYGRTYRDLFNDTANDYYLDLVKSGQIQPDYTVDSDIHLGLKHIIRKTIDEVYTDLKCVIDKQLELNLNSLNYRTLKERVVEEWLPMIELPDEDGAPRFTNVGEDLSSNVSEALVKYFHDLPLKRRALEEAVADYEAKVIIFNQKEIALPGKEAPYWDVVETQSGKQYDRCYTDEVGLRHEQLSKQYSKDPAHQMLHMTADAICKGLKTSREDYDFDIPVTDEERQADPPDGIKGRSRPPIFPSKKHVGGLAGPPYANVSIFLAGPTWGSPKTSHGQDTLGGTRFIRTKKYWHRALKKDIGFPDSPALRKAGQSIDNAANLHWSWRGAKNNWKGRRTAYWAARDLEHSQIAEIDALRSTLYDSASGPYQQMLRAEEMVIMKAAELETIEIESEDSSKEYGTENSRANEMFRLSDIVDVTSLITDPETGEYSGNVKQKFNTLSSGFGADGEPTSFDFSNGNFLLEKSIMFKPKQDLKKHLESFNVSTPIGPSEKIFSVEGEVSKMITDYFYWACEHHFGSSIGNIYASPKKFTTFMEYFLQSIKGATELKEWNAEVFFEDIRPALRLIYVPAVTSPELGRELDNFSDIISYEMDKAALMDSKFSEELKVVGRKTGTYYSEEHHTRETFDIGSGTVTSKDIVTKVYPIPMVDTANVALDPCEENKWLKSPIKNLSSSNSNFVDAYNSSVIQQREVLMESTEFKLLFDFVFPLNRYMSMVNIFSIIVTSDTSSVNSAFVETKDALESIFGILSNTGYQNIGPTEQEVEDAQDLLKGDACFTFDDLPTTPEDLISGEFKSKLNLDIDIKSTFKGKGLKWAKKHFEETGDKIVEQIALTVDPNVMFTKKVVGTINKAIATAGDVLCKDAVCIPEIAFSLMLFSPWWPFPPPGATVLGLPIPPWLTLGINFVLPITPFGAYYILKNPNCPREEVKLYSATKSFDCDEVDACVEKPTTPNVLSQPIPDSEE